MDLMAKEEVVLKTMGTIKRNSALFIQPKLSEKEVSNRSLFSLNMLQKAIKEKFTEINKQR